MTKKVVFLFGESATLLALPSLTLRNCINLLTFVYSQLTWCLIFHATAPLTCVDW
jgi:hypothetical protein